MSPHSVCYGRVCAQVFQNCLFAVPTASTPRDAPPPKAKHATTRRIAFALLEELSKNCDANMGTLCELMVPHHEQPAVAVSKRGYSLPALPKSATGYVGLKNLGCICYMNATMQNFFMVPDFRRGVLNFEDTEEDKKESLMYQMQRMFAFLQETDKQAYNPKGFCYAFKVRAVLLFRVLVFVVSVVVVDVSFTVLLVCCCRTGRAIRPTP